MGRQVVGKAGEKELGEASTNLIPDDFLSHNEEFWDKMLGMYVFGRNSTAPHSRLGELATECTNDPELSLQAIGWNLLADHRVSEERAEHFFDVTGKPSTIDELKRAIVDYQRLGVPATG